jgi:hypothetical protein
MKLLPLILLLLIDSAFALTCRKRSDNSDASAEAVLNDRSACPSGYDEESGDDDNDRGRGRRDGPRESRTATSCKTELKRARDEWRAATTNVDLRKAKINLEATRSCRALEVASWALGEREMPISDSKATTDGLASCKQKAGYTSDWDSCKSTAGIYNSILVLESLMLTTQGLRNQSNQQNIQASANAQQVSGDGQNAIFDASLADNQFKKSLNQEQVMAYSAAVMALGTKIASWKGVEGLRSSCTFGNLAPTATAAGVSALKTLYTSTTLPPTAATPAVPNPNAEIANFLPVIETCADAITLAEQASRSEVVANNDAKQAFSTALVGLLAKVARAKSAMDSLNRNSAVVQAAKDATNTPDNGTVLEKCVITPLDPACVQTTGRVQGEAFRQGNFSVGEGASNNAFDLSGTDTTTPDAATTGSGSGNGNVAGVTSPFGSDAAKANKILDPAAAASITPTGGAGGGGGGVGGGLGGGGGANLGNDLQGEDKGDKASDIKANKLAGNYSGTGGKGFSGVAGTNEENPFASLFDSKAEGGLEEDRSIASDTSGVDSGLFQKISKRYNQVQQEKRIEAGNLE